MNSSLLPPSATELELAIEKATARISAIDAPHSSLWNADTCPEHLLPWLGWALAVDGWNSELATSAKRALIKKQMQLKRIVGCEAAMRDALKAAGFGDVQVFEANQDASKYNNTTTYNGDVKHGYSENWAEFLLIMQSPIANHFVPIIRAIAQQYAPARSKLVKVEYTSVAHAFNNDITYSGNFNYGAA